MKNITLQEINSYAKSNETIKALELLIIFLRDKSNTTSIFCHNFIELSSNITNKSELLDRVCKSLITAKSRDFQSLKKFAENSRKMGNYLTAAVTISLIVEADSNNELVKNDVENFLIINIEYFLQQSLYFELLVILFFVESHFKARRFYIQARSIAFLRAAKFIKSKRSWQEYYERYDSDPSFQKERYLKIRNNTSGKFSILENTSPQGNASKLFQSNTCVYTALFGDYDNLPPVISNLTGIDFICFTDVDRHIPGWKVVKVDRKFENPIKENRYYKLLPHLHLSSYENSLYIDSNIFILADINFLLKKCGNNAFVGWGHPERSDVYSELVAIISNFRHRPDEMLEQFVFFTKERLPKDIGMIEACFLWRSHTDKEVINLMNSWWDFFQYKGNRDQPALGYLMHKLSIKPRIFDDKYGNTRSNDFFYKLPHLGNPLKFFETDKLCNKNKEKISVVSRNSIVWVYREEQKNVASTFMRGYQLSDMVAKRADGGFNVDYVNENNVGNIRDSIVILTKGFLKKATTEEITNIKKKNNIICVDFVDDPERKDIVDAADVLIASSISQLLHYKLTYMNKLSHMITHHVDPEITINRQILDKPSVGYFGELVNAKWREELNDKVSFILTNTKTRTKEWIPELSNYNCHYAVRNRREIDGFKPFLKGYTAAHCNSIIIVPKFEGDARYYLTSDYPYLLKDDSLESVIEMLEIFYDGFGSKEHLLAKDIMDSVRVRSSINAIFLEIENLRGLLC